jgi:hypothetical protein
MDSNATENMPMDIDSPNAVDASIMSTVDMMQLCTLRDSGDDALKFEQAQDVDTDVDTPFNETVQANEMIIDSPQHEHMEHEVRPSTPHSNLKQYILTPSKHHQATTTAPSEPTVSKPKAVHASGDAPKPHHKQVKHLAGVDAKSRAPAAISLNRVTAGFVQRGSTHLLQRHLRTQERKSQLARACAVMEAIQEEA